MYPVSDNVAEEETQRAEGPARERLCGPGQTPQCGEIINYYNLVHIYQDVFAKTLVFLKYSLNTPTEFTMVSAGK